MARKSVIKLQHIYSYFDSEVKLVARGENAYESNHVKQYIFDGDSHIDGQVYASMKDRAYNVEIVLEKDRTIKAAKCSCPRGQAKCHHMAALLLCCHYNISVTDTSCQWSAPTKDQGASARTVDDMYPVPEAYDQYVATIVKDPDSLKKKVYEKLSESKKKCPVGLLWLLSPEPVKQNSLPNDLGPIFASPEFLKATDKRRYLEEKAKIDDNQKKFISEMTAGQILSKEWSILRQNRLTASNFGKVLKASIRNKYPPSLFHQICGNYKLDGLKSIMWGRENEGSAKLSFAHHTQKEIKNTGLWLHESGLLGASPGGFVDGENSIVEIKCPFKYRDSSNQAEILSDKNYIIYLDENNCCVINKNHEYYHQIQGTLYICNCDLCYLVVWTPKTTIVFPVKKDDAWATNIEILLKFYHEKLVPWIIEKK